MEAPHSDISYKSQRCCARWSRLRIMAVVVAAVTVIAVIIVVPVVFSKSSDSQEDTRQVPIDPTALKVAAFNIKSFGISKMSNATVAQRIAQIVSRSDVVLIQEVRDKSGKSLKALKTRLGSEWDYIASDRIGRTSYKEQYVYFYRTKAVKITGEFQHNDTEKDVFEREPFAIEIQYHSSRHSDLRYVTLLGFHSRPDDTPSELQHLAGVIQIVNEYFTQSKGVVAMGDFNADCNFLNSTFRDKLDIFNSNKGFSSKIDDSVDTTASHSTDCAYDRVVTYGNVDVRNAHVYNYETAMGWTEEEAREVSDHYPVEFRLY